MIAAQFLLLGVALALALAAAYPDMPSRWRIGLLSAAAIHAAPLLFTLWRYVLLGGGE
jgi:hypothetical protein